MVRPGQLLYGFGEFAAGLGLRPVMTLKTTVSTIKTYPPDTCVSYGRLFRTTRTTRSGRRAGRVRRRTDAVPV